MNQGAADAGQEQTALDEQTAMAQGKGPSAATALLDQQTATTMNANNAAASSGSGGGGLAKRQAMEANSSALQGLGGQAATARAQEQIGAAANEGNLATGMRGQDIAGANTEAGLATNQAQIGEQQNQTNAQSASNNQKTNAGMLSSLSGAAGGLVKGIFGDADFKEPAPAGSKDKNGEPPAWFTLREERGGPNHKPFIAIIDRTTGEASVLATRRPSDEEHEQLYKPHAAGALDSPDRKHAEMHDMDAVGGGMGNGAGMMGPRGASPGYGAGATAGTMDVGGNTKLVNAQQAAVGGSGGGGAATGTQYADADVGNDDRFAEMVRRAHPGLYKAAGGQYADAEVGPITVGKGVGGDPAYKSTPEGDRAFGEAMFGSTAGGKDAGGNDYAVPGYVPRRETGDEPEDDKTSPEAFGKLMYGQGPKSKEEADSQQAAKDKADAEEKAKQDKVAAAAPQAAPERGHGVVHDIANALKGVFGGFSNPTGAGAAQPQPAVDQQRQQDFDKQVGASQKAGDPRSTFMQSQGAEHFVPPAPESPKIVAPPNPEKFSDAEMRGPYAARGAPQDGDSAPGTTEQLGPEDPRLAAIRKAMAESDQSAKGTKTYSDGEVKGAYATRGTADDGDAAPGLTEQRDDEDPRLSEIRKAMAGSDQSAKGTKTYSDGDFLPPTEEHLTSEGNAGKARMQEIQGHEFEEPPEAEDRGFDRPDLAYSFDKLPQPSLTAQNVGMHSPGYRTTTNEAGGQEIDAPEETMRVAPPSTALARVMSKRKKTTPDEHATDEEMPERLTSAGQQKRRGKLRRANATLMDGDMGMPVDARSGPRKLLPDQNFEETHKAKGGDARTADREGRKAQLRSQLKDVDAWEDSQRKTYPDADAHEAPARDADEPPEFDVEDLPGKRAGNPPVDLDAVVPDVDDEAGWPAAKTTYAPTRRGSSPGLNNVPRRKVEDPAAIPANWSQAPDSREEVARHVSQTRDIERMNPYGPSPKTPALATLFPDSKQTGGAGPVDFMQALHLANQKYDRRPVGTSVRESQAADKESRRRAVQLRSVGLDVVPGEFEQLAETAPPEARAGWVSAELEKRSASRKAVKALVAKWEAERKGRKQYADGDVGEKEPFDEGEMGPGPQRGASLRPKPKTAPNPKSALVVVMRPGSSKPRVRVREAG